MKKSVNLTFAPIFLFFLISQNLFGDILFYYTSATLPAIIAKKVPPIPVEIDIVIKKTGQTNSYNTKGEKIYDDDEPIYDDGYYETGETHRYTRASDIVTDELTQRMWQDDADARKIYGTFAEGLSYCSSLELGGYSDWRMPAISELEEIVDYSGNNDDAVAIDATFQNVYLSDVAYWTSSSTKEHEDNNEYSSNAWIVKFLEGYSTFSTKRAKYYFRCVRD